jgi:hypothetical protein
MRDLGVLPGDFDGAGLAINNRGEVVGPSFSAPGPPVETRARSSGETARCTISTPSFLRTLRCIC